VDDHGEITALVAVTGVVSCIPVTAAISSTTPSGVTVAVSGIGAVGVGANIVAAPLVSRPAGGRALLLMVTMLLGPGTAGGRRAARCPSRVADIPAWRW
jgi:hypothetical protein